MPNITKFNAYKKVLNNYQEAIDKLNERPLAFGEPAVVAYYYPSVDDENKVIKLLLGVGSINGEIALFDQTGVSKENEPIVVTKPEDDPIHTPDSEDNENESIYFGVDEDGNDPNLTYKDSILFENNEGHVQKIVTVVEEKEYIMFAIPSNMSPIVFNVGGNENDFEDINEVVSIEGKEYKLYRTNSQYNIGDHFIQVTIRRV